MLAGTAFSRVVWHSGQPLSTELYGTGKTVSEAVSEGNRTRGAYSGAGRVCGAFLEMLATDDREQARQFMQAALKPQVQERIRMLDALAEKGDSMLNQKDYVYGRKPQGTESL